MIRLYFLGLPEVRNADGASVPLRTRKMMHLLALLWLNRDQPQARSRIAGLLWPDSAESNARNNLSQILHHLHKTLESEDAAGCLQSDHHSIQFDTEAPHWVDVEAFEQHLRSRENEGDPVEDLEAAIGLYRGELIEDCYDDWCLVERDRLRSLYLSGLLDLVTLLRERGQLETSIEYAKRLLAITPWQEDVHRQLMAIHLQIGNRSAALAQYRDCRQLLADELGVEPSKETEELYAQIQRDGGSPNTDRSTQFSPHKGTVADQQEDPSQTRQAVAVLPFINMSPDIENEYFCDGLTEELINALTKVEDLRVAAQTSVFTFKHRTEDVREIGRRLNVTSVLEGSVRRSNGRLRINALITDVASGYHLWSEQFDRELSDIFTIQEEIADAIVQILKRELQHKGFPSATLDKPPTNIEAYLLYLRGRFFWHQRTEDGLKRAIEYFERAIDIDPQYARAYAGLSDTYGVLGYYHISEPLKNFLKAKEFAETALSLDNTIAEAHASRGLASDYLWDWDLAGKAYQQALRIRPGYATGRHWYALYLMNMGQLAMALEQISLAHQADPYSLPINRDWGQLLYMDRQYDRALEQLESTAEMSSAFPYVHLYLGLVQMERSAYQDALDAFETEAEVSGGRDSLAEVMIARVHAEMGDATQAREQLQRATDKTQDTYISPYFTGLGWLALGEDDRAFAAFERAYEQHDFFLSRLQVDPMLDDVRGDERYHALLRKMGLSDYDM